VKLCTLVIILTSPLFLLEAHAQPVNCSQRTAEDYVPLTRSDRAADYLRRLIGPQAFVYAGALAGLGQWENRPREWGQGAAGYGLRYRDSFARNSIVATLQDGLALGLDEDNRYFTSGEHGLKRRLEYVLTSPFLARHSDGSRTLSISALGGVAAGSLIQQAWQPPSTAYMGNAVRSFALTFAFREGLHFFREFAPRRMAEMFR
jgi:hypothetical protein